MLPSTGQDHTWPPDGEDGYRKRAASGVRNASQHGTPSQVAQTFARGLYHPCRPACPKCFRVRGNMEGGPQMGKVVRQPELPCGSLMLQGAEQNQNWPSSWMVGYRTLATLGVLTAL